MAEPAGALLDQASFSSAMRGGEEDDGGGAEAAAAGRLQAMAQAAERLFAADSHAGCSVAEVIAVLERTFVPGFGLEAYRAFFSERIVGRSAKGSCVAFSVNAFAACSQLLARAVTHPLIVFNFGSGCRLLAAAFQQDFERRVKQLVPSAKMAFVHSDLMQWDDEVLEPADVQALAAALRRWGRPAPDTIDQPHVVGGINALPLSEAGKKAAKLEAGTADVICLNNVVTFTDDDLLRLSVRELVALLVPGSGVLSVVCEGGALALAALRIWGHGLDAGCEAVQVHVMTPPLEQPAHHPGGQRTVAVQLRRLSAAELAAATASGADRGQRRVLAAIEALSGRQRIERFQSPLDGVIYAVCTDAAGRARMETDGVALRRATPGTLTKERAAAAALDDSCAASLLLMWQQLARGEPLTDLQHFESALASAHTLPAPGGSPAAPCPGGRLEHGPPALAGDSVQYTGSALRASEPTFKGKLDARARDHRNNPKNPTVKFLVDNKLTMRLIPLYTVRLPESLPVRCWERMCLRGWSRRRVRGVGGGGGR